MTRNYTLLLYAALSIFSLSDASAQQGVEISFEQAVGLINSGNKSLKIADQEVDWAESERQRLNALWYPQVSATGAYAYLGNRIEVKESL